MGPEPYIRAQTRVQDLHRAADRAHLAKMDVTHQDLKRLRGPRNTARASAFMSMFARLFPQIRRPSVALEAVTEPVNDHEIMAAVRRHHNMDVSHIYAHLKVDAGGPSRAAVSRRLQELAAEGALRTRQDAGITRYSAAPASSHS